MSSERARQKNRLLTVAFGWSNMSLCIQRSSFRLSANYVFNNVLRALRDKLLFENSPCHSTKLILYLGNESDFYLSGNNVAEANILELMYEISTYWLWPLEPFSVPFGAPARSDYFQSLFFCPNISLAGSGLPLQVSPWASGKAQATCSFTAAQVNAKHVPLVHIVCCKRFSNTLFISEISAEKYIFPLFLPFSVIITFFGNTMLEKKLRSPCYVLSQDNTAHMK